MPDKGGIALLLHAHLPFVINHGRWPHGTDWLNEAAAEVYVPFLVMLRNLERDKVPCRLTMGLTPVLCEQLDSDAFRLEFRNYLEQRISAARDNERMFRQHGQEALAALAQGWTGYYQSVRHEFDSVWHGTLLDGFRYFMQQGSIELLSCAATHGYLPLLGRDSAIQAQLQVGAAAHRRHFGSQARGAWLPECGYRPRGEWSFPGLTAGATRRGLEEFLPAIQAGYFVVDTHTLRGGKPAGMYSGRFCQDPHAVRREIERSRENNSTGRSVHVPYLVDSGAEPAVAVFARDPDASMVVWSGELGYPGDGAYLDFHKKHHPGGLRYWRVTDVSVDMAGKHVYEPAAVTPRLETNSDHFVALSRALLADSRAAGIKTPILTAPFDAELFGHWWFEGMRWLEQVIRKTAVHDDVELVSLGDYLEANRPTETVALSEGSWGEGGGHAIWMNEGTRWLWAKLHEAEERMENLVRTLFRMEREYDHHAERMRAVLNQTARSLLLLESSDWPFLISTRGAQEYAEARFRRHLDDFGILAGMAQSLQGGIALAGSDMMALRYLSQRDFLFPHLDLSWWAG